MTDSGAERTPVALVTGANHGIGAAVARGLAAAGCDVVVTYLRFAAEATPPSLPDDYGTQRAADASDVVAAIEATGRQAVAIEADLADPAVIASLFDAAEEALGPVSVLVHNASGWRRDTFAPVPEPDGVAAAPAMDAVGSRDRPVTAVSADAQLLVDARAGALLMTELIDRHRRRGADWGRIVTMTSGTGGGYPGQVSYGAAKAALISYTLSAAAEMAADGVCANVVYPPVTDTGWITDDVRAFVAGDHEHHHIATPDEVAATVVWLCTQANHLVTGNVIRLR